jgi:methylmalonyl-CoA mutase N-terminal domain/subunit
MQTEKLILLKNNRDNQAVLSSLNQLQNAAKGQQNLMPFILSAVEQYATLGEIADTLREVFGEH